LLRIRACEIEYPSVAIRAAGDGRCQGAYRLSRARTRLYDAVRRFSDILDKGFDHLHLAFPRLVRKNLAHRIGESGWSDLILFDKCGETAIDSREKPQSQFEVW
jgi:hypothetical protein